MRRPWRRSIGAFLTGSLLACGPESPPPPPPAPAQAPVAAAEEAEPPLPIVPTRPEPAPVAPPDASFSGPDQAPADVPDDLPLYASAAPVSSMSSPSRGTIVNLRSNDAPEPIFAWYRDELPKRGWLLDKQSGAGSNHLLTARKGGRKATVFLKAGEGGTQILLTVAQDQ